MILTDATEPLSDPADVCPAAPHRDPEHRRRTLRHWTPSQRCRPAPGVRACSSCARRDGHATRSRKSSATRARPPSTTSSSCPGCAQTEDIQELRTLRRPSRRPSGCGVGRAMAGAVAAIRGSGEANHDDGSTGHQVEIRDCRGEGQSKMFHCTALLTCAFTTHGCTALSRSSLRRYLE